MISEGVARLLPQVLRAYKCELTQNVSEPARKRKACKEWENSLKTGSPGRMEGEVGEGPGCLCRPSQNGEGKTEGQKPAMKPEKG